MDWQTAIDVLTAVCAAHAAVGVYRLLRGHDNLSGKIETIETAHNAHVNAAGLHSR